MQDLFPLAVIVRLMQPLDSEKRAVVLSSLDVSELCAQIKKVYGIRKFNMYFFAEPRVMLQIDTASALLCFLRLFTANNSNAYVLVWEWENLDLESQDTAESSTAAAGSSSASPTSSLGDTRGAAAASSMDDSHGSSNVPSPDKSKVALALLQYTPVDTGAQSPCSNTSPQTGGSNSSSQAGSSNSSPRAGSSNMGRQGPPPPVACHVPRHVPFRDGDILRTRLQLVSASSVSAAAFAVPTTAVSPHLYRAWPGHGNFFGDIDDDVAVRVNLLGVPTVLPPSALSGWNGISLYSDPGKLRAAHAGTEPLYRASAQAILTQQPLLQLLQHPAAPDHFGLSPLEPMGLADFEACLALLAPLFELDPDADTPVAAAPASSSSASPRSAPSPQARSSASSSPPPTLSPAQREMESRVDQSKLEMAIRGEDDGRR